MRQDTDKPTLVADKLAASCRLLVNRIHERFPDRGIDVHANRLADYAERLIQSGSHSISAPVVLRIVSWMGGIAAGLLLISPVYFVRAWMGSTCCLSICNPSMPASRCSPLRLPDFYNAFNRTRSHPKKSTQGPSYAPQLCPRDGHASNFQVPNTTAVSNDTDEIYARRRGNRHVDEPVSLLLR